MSANRDGTLQQIALVLTSALEPLRSELEDGVAFFSSLGIRLTPAQASTPALNAAQTLVRDRTSQLVTKAGSLNVAVDGGTITDVSSRTTEVLALANDVIDGFSGIATALTTIGIPGFNAAQFPTRLLHELVFRFMNRTPGLAEALELLRVVETITLNAGTDDEVDLHVLHLENIGPWIGSAGKQLQSTYGWGTPTFDGTELLRAAHRILVRAGLPVLFESSGGATRLDVVLADIRPRIDLDPKGLVVVLQERVAPTKQGYSQDDWHVDLQFDPTLLGGAQILVQPNGNLTALPPAGHADPIQGTVQLNWTARRASDPSPFVILGVPGGSRFEVAEAVVAIGTFLQWTASDKTARGVFQFEARSQGCKLVLAVDGADGFLRTLIPAAPLELDFDFGVGVSSQTGLYFVGSSGLETQLPMHLRLGPVEIVSTTLALQGDSGGVALAAGVDFKTHLGALDLVVRNMGLAARLSFPASGGNGGPVNFDLRFKPPASVSLAVDAGGFKGGGFLRFDPANDEYAGALELDFQGLFSVKAIAIINTKMPDGSSGFSLLVLITAEFTPIQLSFGFTLNGVGGLFGLNRTIFVNALVEGIRTNAISSVLFPQDIIANVTRIISDIKQFFPPQEGHFVVGPIGKLGWGTPSIITAEMGLLLDLPNPMFAIVGVLRAMLPAEDAPILRLQVNFIGVLGFDRGYLFFRADLFDSRLLIYSITGSMAFLVSWGEQQTFALSVGGFHPDFRDIPTIPALPDGFRNMARIGISLLSDDNPRLKVESYFAVTSNTVQFGARVELYACAGDFNVYGFLGYDVLFQFDPFRFIAKLYGGIALRSGADVIAGINIMAQLAGPEPWDARGTATLTILFFDIDVDFHITWGDPPRSVENKTEDLLDLLKRQLADTGNWRTELPPDNHLHVSLRTIETPTTGEALLVIHPAGVLTFSERVLPLGGYTIEKFGTRKPLADNKFTLSNANAGGLPIPADYQGIREQFAINQFTELSDSEKLSRCSFEPLPSGLSLTGTSNLQATLPVTREVVYELSYLRRKPIRLEFRGIVRLALFAYDKLVKGCAVRRSVLAKQESRKSLNTPPEVHLPAEEFAVASVADLTPYAAAGEAVKSFRTEAEAYQHQKDLIRRNPALTGQIQVVSQYELAN